MKYAGLHSVIILCFILGCASDAKQTIEQAEGNLATENAPTEVVTVAIAIKPFTYLIECNGQMEALRQVQVPLQSAGLIQELPISNGQWVEEGQLLAALQNDEQQLALEKARAQLKERHVDYASDLMGFSNARNDTLIRENLRYSSGLVAAELAVKETKMALAHTQLKAPMSGTVADLNLKTGDLVPQGEVLCTVYSNQNLMLHTQVLESDIGQIRIGQKAELRALALPDSNYLAQVKEINPRVDENGMVQVKLLLQNTKGLLPGMHATAIIQIPQDSSLIVPKEAVVIRSDKEVVFTEEAGFAKWNYVSIGLDNGREVQILDGLEGQGKVIVTNNLQLAHDAPVQVENME